MKKLLLLLICSHILAQEVLSETIVFDSRNPFSFEEVINNLDNQEKQTVTGILGFPADFDVEKKYPLIVGVAGSLNWGPHHLKYLEMYRSLGFATFQLQSFDSRDIQSTVGSQVEVTSAMMILDSYLALETLSAHPNIDINRVGITGWSLGGTVSLYSAWMPLISSINNGKYRFAAHLPIYPGCLAYPHPAESMIFSQAPTHILIGELDDWVPASACTNLLDKLNESELPHNIDITIYENAHHSFDREMELTTMENGYTLGDCFFPMSNEGELYLSEFWNIPINTPLRQKLALLTCAGRGPTMGGNDKAREQSFKFAADFFINHLK
jgi:dienelactone hydrolase